MTAWRRQRKPLRLPSKLTWTLQARRDVLDIYELIGLEQPAAAERYFDRTEALAGLLFLYEEVLQQPLDRLRGVVRAKRPKRLPSVLSPEEVQKVLGGMSGQPRVIATLLYGAGLRLLEALQLRVIDACVNGL